jgi:hypothetical protein
MRLKENIINNGIVKRNIMAESHKPTVNGDSSVTKEKQKSDKMKINVCLCRLLQQSGSLKLRS